MYLHRETFGTVQLSSLSLSALRVSIGEAPYYGVHRPDGNFCRSFSSSSKKEKKTSKGDSKMTCFHSGRFFSVNVIASWRNGECESMRVGENERMREWEYESMRVSEYRSRSIIPKLGKIWNHRFDWVRRCSKLYEAPVHFLRFPKLCFKHQIPKSGNSVPGRLMTEL